MRKDRVRAAKFAKDLTRSPQERCQNLAPLHNESLHTDRDLARPAYCLDVSRFCQRHALSEHTGAGADGGKYTVY